MDTLATWTERLADYLKRHGPVGTACVVPAIVEDELGNRHGWQAIRGTISLSADGEPVYCEKEKPAPLREGHYRAQRDLEEIVSSEKRVIFHCIPGKMTADECELAMAVLADATGRQDLWP